jgi:hydrogenase maturation factor
MNLFQGEITEIYIESGMRTCTVRVNGILRRASLTLLPEANVGDSILINAGVGISKIEHRRQERRYVSRNPR